MTNGYDLTRLDETSFEHMVNFLALTVLGSGHTGFGPGPDGGRDGYFEGEAPYPSAVEHWSGKWYIQAKFHKPHLSKDPQKWLLEQIKKELDAFRDPSKERQWPDNWIIVTNIDPSGVPNTGAFDQARKLVSGERRGLAKRFHIWGGRKVLDLLHSQPNVADYYYQFLTPGHVLSALYSHLGDYQADAKDIVRYLTVTQFNEQQYTKLEQAGSATDGRPGIHHLFTDLPFISKSHAFRGLAACDIAATLSQNHRVESQFPADVGWSEWSRHPRRARIWFVRGGPGQGKSTVGQYVCQIQRAALILSDDPPACAPTLRSVAIEVRETAQKSGLWPVAPRIPVTVELKDYAHWYGDIGEEEAGGVLTYLSHRISISIEQPVHAGTLRRAFSNTRWMFVFDGLDEVPSDVKGAVAKEVVSFIDDVLIGCEADAFILCTSRPQGYSGQFDVLDAANVQLVDLSPEQALACASPVLKIDRALAEYQRYREILEDALNSPAIKEIMTTPLQSHIMAVVVRDGGRPPERKWQLFANFYAVIKKREANRNLPDKRLAALLREGDKLLKALHNRLGFELHARAETAEGAQTSLDRGELLRVVVATVSELRETDIDETVNVLMEATTQRLVLVNTPESGDKVRFDIRPLQEFFASEYIYEGVAADSLSERVSLVAGDAHWREVMHYMFSALVENQRQTELVLAIKVLVNLDEGGENSGQRALYRRLALGGVIASRLLAEGVLEQDKRVRQQFRPCFDSIFSSTGLVCLSALTPIHSVESEAWMIESLFRCIFECAESESIGAAVLLARINLVDDRKRDQLVKKLLRSTPEYLAALFRLVRMSRGSFDEPDVATSDWVLRLAFSCVCADDWYRLGPAGLSSAFEVLAGHLEEIPALAQEFGIDPSLKEFWYGLLRIDRRWLRERVKPESIEEEIAGVVRIESYPPASILDVGEWSPADRRNIASLPGVFKLIEPILSIGRAKNRASVARLKEVLDGDFLRLEGLPLLWLNFLPPEIRAWRRLGSGGGETERRLSWKYKSGYRQEITIERFRDLSRSEWQNLVSKRPYIALHMLQRIASKDNAKSFVRSPKSIDIFLEEIKKSPGRLVDFPESWGLLVELSGPFEDKVRAIIRKSAEWPVKSDIFRDKIIAFELRIEQDCLLLPHIACLLTDSSGYFFEHDEIVRGRPKTTSDWLTEYVPRPEGLFDIIVGSHKQLVSASAAVMYLLHHESDPAKFGECRNILTKAYAEEQVDWLLRASATTASALIELGDAEAINWISELLDIGRKDFAGRISADGLMEAWRQFSRAPVTRAEQANSDLLCT